MKYYKPELEEIKISYNGIGFTGLLTIVFIVLKLLGIIKWKWVMVFCPLWISLICFVIICLVVYFIIKKV